MAANELAAHASLQPPTVIREPQHVSLLLGGFSPTSGRTAGEQVCISLTDADPELCRKFPLMVKKPKDKRFSSSRRFFFTPTLISKKKEPVFTGVAWQSMPHAWELASSTLPKYTKEPCALRMGSLNQVFCCAER